MIKTNLEDVTFLIPVRLDSVQRIENLLATIQSLTKYFNTNIIILESTSFNNGILYKLLIHNIKYIFVEDKDPVFYRTKYLNQMIREVKTPFLAVWDSDVIVDKIQITNALEKLRSNEADIAYPYNGQFYDTSDIIRRLYLKRKNINILHKNSCRMFLIYGSNHKGGGFIANTEKYKQAGMENENFYGWGPEDTERYERWIKLRYNIYHSPGCMFHLSHPRDLNGQFNSQLQMKITRSELSKTMRSTREELIGNFN